MTKKKPSNTAIIKSVNTELQTAYLISVWCGLGFAIFFSIYLQPLIGETFSHLIMIVAGVVAVIVTILILALKRKY